VKIAKTYVFVGCVDDVDEYDDIAEQVGQPRQLLLH
jgi:hypothetical protein